jgi:hypothetical protein
MHIILRNKLVIHGIPEGSFISSIEPQEKSACLILINEDFPILRDDSDSYCENLFYELFDKDPIPELDIPRNKAKIFKMDYDILLGVIQGKFKVELPEDTLIRNIYYDNIKNMVWITLNNALFNTVEECEVPPEIELNVRPVVSVR